MKKYFLTVLMMLSGFSAQASVRCEYKAHDLPRPIIGIGDTKASALGDAIEKCFDARVEAFEKMRKTTVDMDRGQDFIDSCANIRCSYKTAQN